MLSKLLIKVGNNEAVSLQDGSKNSGENTEGLDSSKKVFQSLLSALQGEGKGNSKNLIKLADGSTSQSEKASSENTDRLATVLGGHFSSLQKPVDGEAKDLNATKESVPNIEVNTEVANGKQEGDKAIMNNKQPASQADKKTETVEGKKMKKVATESSEKTTKAPVNAKQEKATKMEATVVKEEATGKQAEKSPTKLESPVPTEKVVDSAEKPPAKLESQVSTEKVVETSEKNSSGNVKTDSRVAQTEKIVEGGEKPDGESTEKKAREIKEKPSKVLTRKGTQTNSDEKPSTQVDGDKESANKANKADAKKSANVADPRIKKTTEGTGKGELKENPQPERTKSTSETTENKEKVDLSRSKAGVKHEHLKTSQRTSLDQQLKKQPRPELVVNNRRSPSVDQIENRRKPVENFFQKNSTVTSDQKGLEFKSMQVEKMRKKQKDSDRKRSNIENRGRNPELNRIGFSGRTRQQSLPPLSLASSSDNTFLDSSSSAWKEDLVWENQLGESGEMKESQDTKKSSSSSSTMRLGQIPVSNINLRKQILPGLTKTVTQAASEAQKTPDQWQKHNFVLDDGKNIQLSVRESKGVLHVKMGSLNMDLSKLLQQNMQQIREHLEQEFGTDVNLQFENQDQHPSEFSEDSESSNNEQNHPKTFMDNELAVENTAQIDLESIRRFGYNQMEWTA